MQLPILQNCIAVLICASCEQQGGMVSTTYRGRDTALFCIWLMGYGLVSTALGKVMKMVLCRLTPLEPGSWCWQGKVLNNLFLWSVSLMRSSYPIQTVIFSNWKIYFHYGKGLENFPSQPGAICTRILQKVHITISQILVWHSCDSYFMRATLTTFFASEDLFTAHLEIQRTALNCICSFYENQAALALSSIIALH